MVPAILVRWLLAVALLGCYGLWVCLGISGFWAATDELERPLHINKIQKKINNMLRAFTGSGLWLLVWGLWVKVSICWYLRQGGAVGC